MKPLWKDTLSAIFMGLVLPGLLLNAGAMLLSTRAAPAAVAETTAAETAAEETLPPKVSLPVLVRAADGAVTEMDMDTYLVGVVLAEMPADFEPEALKAQSVAARTYSRKAYETGGKHGDGSICTDPTCCQAYLTQEDYLALGGTPEGLQRVEQAVAATSGYVLTYEGSLIEATYFSCSGGSTEDAVAVWGTDFPYLQSVDSPGEEKAIHFSDTFSFTPEAFQQALGSELSGPPSGWFRNVTFTRGGGIASMEIGGVSYTGVELRSLLGLPSTDFTVSATEDAITITTYGYGHRVGMSQYGADAMAATGNSFQDILAHYYQGAELTKLTDSLPAAETPDLLTTANEPD